jgi:HPt (histidine-containing phosphotransfer) domain-containing protein
VSDSTLVNIPKVCAMLMLDEDSVKNLFKKFAEMLPEMVDEIRIAVESKDALLVSKLGHKLKGTAGNFRVQEMQSIGDKINKLKSCDEEASSLVLELEDCTMRLIAQINKTC